MGEKIKWITQPALIFSPDGSGAPESNVLKMSEIFNLRLNADLGSVAPAAIVLAFVSPGTLFMRKTMSC